MYLGKKNCMEFCIFCFPTLNWSATLCLLLCSFKCQVHIQSKLYYIFVFLSPLYCIFCLLCNTVRPVSPYLAVTQAQRYIYYTAFIYPIKLSHSYTHSLATHRKSHSTFCIISFSVQLQRHKFRQSLCFLLFPKFSYVCQFQLYITLCCHLFARLFFFYQQLVTVQAEGCMLPGYVTFLTLTIFLVACLPFTVTACTCYSEQMSKIQVISSAIKLQILL